MTDLDDLAVCEAIDAVGDRGVTAHELGEKFGTDHWAIIDVCRKLQRDGTVTTRTRTNTSLIVYVRRDVPRSRFGRPSSGHTEPFM